VDGGAQFTSGPTSLSYVCDVAIHCSSRGVCTKNGSCVCIPGWRGAKCDTLDCSVVDNCNSHGLCVLNVTANYPTCECFKSYTGELCDIPVCALNCENGGSPDPNSCSCLCQGYFNGTFCETCDIECDHGKKIEEDGKCECDCDDNYIGDLCDECNIVCQFFGVKDEANCTCDCSNTDPPHAGFDCSICSTNCNSGTADPLDCNLCICVNGWSGFRCDVDSRKKELAEMVSIFSSSVGENQETEDNQVLSESTGLYSDIELLLAAINDDSDDIATGGAGRLRQQRNGTETTFNGTKDQTVRQGLDVFPVLPRFLYTNMTITLYGEVSATEPKLELRFTPTSSTNKIRMQKFMIVEHFVWNDADNSSKILIPVDLT